MFSITLAILTIFTMLLLATFVYLTNPTGRINRYFVFFVTFLMLWMISNFLENEPSLIATENLETFLRLDFIFALFLFYGWFRFSYIFSRTSFRLLDSPLLYKILLLLGVGLAGLSLFSEQIITDIIFDGTIITFSDGTLWLPYALYILGLSVGGLVVLFLGRRKAKKNNNQLVKQQIDLVFLGFILAVGNAVFINLILQTFFPISLEVSRLGIFGMIVLVAFTSYAIVKHHFFDVKLVVVRTFTFLTFILFFIISYGYLLTVFVSYAFGETLPTGVVIVSIMFTVLTALGFGPLYKYISLYSSKIFYRSHYNPDRLLGELTHIMATDINVDTMTKKLLHLISERLHLSSARLAIINKDNTYDLRAGDDDSSFTKAEAVTLAEICNKHLPAASTTYMLMLRSLEEGPDKHFLRTHNIGMVIPIRVAGENVAMLILGEKLSGETYSDIDIPFLNIFANEAGIAIRNAQSYLEIKRFNEELEELVKERTTQLESAQKQALKKAQAVADLKDEFVFLATHELRTPVTAIKLFLELTNSKKYDFPDQFKKNLESITSANEHLEQLIDDLLEVARSESSEVVIEIEEVDVHQIVTEVLDELSPLINKQEITVEIDGVNNSTLVSANKNKLREVITNLLSNAIKYNNNGGSIAVKFIDFTDSLIIEIKDTGVGIPDNEQEQIFQKFFRAESAKTGKVVGTGLGMFITRMLVEKMGGTISFSSVQDEGTTTAFSLPKVTKKDV